MWRELEVATNFSVASIVTFKKSLSLSRWWRNRAQVWIAVIVAATCLVSMSTAESLIENEYSTITSRQSRTLSIFGVDDRKPVSDATVYPYSAVGILQWSADRICTATLIGSRFAVTAAECVISADGKDLPSTNAQFRIGVGASAVLTKVNKVHKQSDFWKKWTDNTYVILELDSPLGEKYGKLLLPVLEDLDQSIGKTFVQMVGFHDDVAKSTPASPATLKFSKCTCYFPASFDGPQYLIHHDCDTSPIGSPGSPLLVRYTSMNTYIIAIHTNAIDGGKTPETSSTFPSYTDANANRGVLGPFIQKHLLALEAESNSSSGTGTTTGEPSSSTGQTNSTSPRKSKEEEQGGSNNEVKSKSDGSIVTQSQIIRSSLSPSVAYAAIGIVGGAWVCILFIALRHVRRGQPTLT